MSPRSANTFICTPCRETIIFFDGHDFRTPEVAISVAPMTAPPLLDIGTEMIEPIVTDPTGGPVIPRHDDAALYG